MTARRSTVLIASLLGVLALGASCPTSTKDGACISTVVQFNTFSRVYCYEGWSKSDCTKNNTDQVNGAGWSFYAGDTCGKHGYQEGSNTP